MAHIKHGDQRNLGSFPTAKRAAQTVLYFMCGLTGVPPTPGKKYRNKRGEGSRKRDRHKSACRLSPPQPAPLLTVPCLARSWPEPAHERVSVEEGEDGEEDASSTATRASRWAHSCAAEADERGG